MKDKNIRKEGDGWSIRAIAIGVPSKDVAISLKLNRKMRYSEVAAARKTIEECIEDWFLDSKGLDGKHFIKEIKTPFYGHDREMPMVFLVELSVLSRKIIEPGRGESCFLNVFEGEIDRLIDCLGLE